MSDIRKPLRVRPWLWVLFAVVVFFAADYTWVETVGPRPRRSLGFFRMPSGCPMTAARGDYGLTDYDWTLRRLDGAELSLEQFRGQVVFLNVWATWCGPCVAEMPSIEALYKSLPREGVAFLLISDENADTVQRFVEKHGLTTPVYLTAVDVPEPFATRGIPATFVVDRQGNVVHKRVGGAEWDTDACRGLIRSLLTQVSSETIVPATVAF